MEKSDKTNKIILVCLENVIAQFDEHVIQQYNQIYNPKRKKELKSRRFHIIEYNFKTTEKQKIQDIYNAKGFWNQVQPVDGAIRALHEMSGMGFHVRIITGSISTECGNAIEGKLEWISRMFHTKNWLQRVLITNDKTALRGDILIDSDPTPEKRGNIQPTWKHVVFNQPFNQNVKDKPRMYNWANWKQDLGLDVIDKKKNFTRPYFIHGSTDSADVDKYYLFDELPTSSECQNFCRGLENEDRNLIVVDNQLGVIVGTFKGKPDECNNSLFTTYGLHKQDYKPCPVKSKVTRVVPIKALCIFRKLLGRLSHTCYRELVKLAINSTFDCRLKTLGKIDFTKCCDELKTDDCKYIAFQLAITIALMRGKEIYTKQSAAEMFPDLKPFIYRDEKTMRQNLKIINKYRDVFLRELSDINLQQKDNLLHCSVKKEVKEWTPMKCQCSGLVITYDTEELLAFPFDHQQPIENPSWIMDNLEYHKPVVNLENIGDNCISVFIYKNELCFTGRNHFEDEYTEKAKTLAHKYQLEKLDFKKYFHILSVLNDQLFLIGMRMIARFELVSEQQLLETAKAAGLGTYVEFNNLQRLKKE